MDQNVEIIRRGGKGRQSSPHPPPSKQAVGCRWRFSDRPSAALGGAGSGGDGTSRILQSRFIRQPSLLQSLEAPQSQRQVVLHQGFDGHSFGITQAARNADLVQPTHTPNRPIHKRSQSQSIVGRLGRAPGHLLIGRLPAVDEDPHSLGLAQTTHEVPLPIRQVHRCADMIWPHSGRIQGQMTAPRLGEQLPVRGG